MTTTTSTTTATLTPTATLNLYEAKELRYGRLLTLWTFEARSLEEARMKVHRLCEHRIGKAEDVTVSLVPAVG